MHQPGRWAACWKIARSWSAKRNIANSVRHSQARPGSDWRSAPSSAVRSAERHSRLCRERTIMYTPPVPADEAARLAALERYYALAQRPAAQLDDLARLVAAICETPIALISLIGVDR